MARTRTRTGKTGHYKSHLFVGRLHSNSNKRKKENRLGGGRKR